MGFNPFQQTHRSYCKLPTKAINVDNHPFEMIDDLPIHQHKLHKECKGEDIMGKEVMEVRQSS